jgi:hypothetical protein
MTPARRLGLCELRTVTYSLCRPECHAPSSLRSKLSAGAMTTCVATRGRAPRTVSGCRVFGPRCRLSTNGSAASALSGGVFRQTSTTIWVRASTNFVGGRHCGRCAPKQRVVARRTAPASASLPSSRWPGRVQPRLLRRPGSRSRPSMCALPAWLSRGGQPRVAGTSSGSGGPTAAAAPRRRRGATRRPRGERLLLRRDACDRELLFESVCEPLRRRFPMRSLRRRRRAGRD